MFARLLIVVLLFAAAPAAGQRVDRQDRDRAVQAARDEQVRADRLRSDARATGREVEALRRRLVGLADSQLDDEGRVSEQRRRLTELNAGERALTTRMASQRAVLTRLLGALQLYSRDPPPALLVSPGSATDAVRAAILMRAVTPQLKARADVLSRQAAAIAAARRRAALAGEQLFTLESAVEDRRAEIERLLAEKQTLEFSLNAEAVQAEAQARALAARARDLGGLIGELDTRAPVAAGAGTGPQRLTRPVSGDLVGRFGAGARGLSWRVDGGAQVVAPLAGTVDYAGPLEGWAQVVIIRAADGWRVVLAGLTEVYPGAGRAVAAGEPVGRMGETEEQRRDLYMELRRGETPVDPAARLALR